MKATSHTVSDVLDRIYSLALLHGDVVEVDQVGVIFGSGWERFRKGHLTYLVVKRGDKLYTMYVPSNSVQWIFDCYGT